MSRREKNNEKRRRRLLAAARTLFDRQGFEATTVAQIARLSKSALRTVYNVFPTKMDILAALLSSEAKAQLTARLAESRAAGNSSPQQRLLQFLEMLTHVFADGSRHESRLVSAHAISAGRTTLAGRIYDDIDREVQRRILDLLLELQTEQALRSDVRAEPLARLVFNAVNGLFFLWLGDDAMTRLQCYERLEEHVAILLPPARVSAERKADDGESISSNHRNPGAKRPDVAEICDGHATSKSSGRLIHPARKRGMGIRANGPTPANRRRHLSG